MPRLRSTDYFKQLIPDPVAVMIFDDKILIVRADGTAIEKELPLDVEQDYDDMPEGHG